jgi:mono/diheme cytochrome c family protein
MKTMIAAAMLAMVISPAALAAGDAAAGKEVFQQRCTPCHGADATGDTPVAKAFNADLNLHDKKAQSLTDDQIADIIKNGNTAKGGKMPKPPGVTDADVPNLVAYIRTLADKK